jgi:hypothetical protein
VGDGFSVLENKWLLATVSYTIKVAKNEQDILLSISHIKFPMQMLSNAQINHKSLTRCAGPRCSNPLTSLRTNVLVNEIHQLRLISSRCLVQQPESTNEPPSSSKPESDGSDSRWTWRRIISRPKTESILERLPLLSLATLAGVGGLMGEKLMQVLLPVRLALHVKDSRLRSCGLLLFLTG